MGDARHRLHGVRQGRHAFRRASARDRQPGAVRDQSQDGSARGFEAHMYNYWPQWGVQLTRLLNERKYEQVQETLVRVALPFYSLWVEIEQEFTGGDGYLDKLCMELVGLDSSRCRPPTRDIRPRYR